MASTPANKGDKNTKAEKNKLFDFQEIKYDEIRIENKRLFTENKELLLHNTSLAEENEYLEALLTSIHKPMLVLHKDCKVKGANQSFYTKFQTNKEETIGVLLSDLGNNQWNIIQLQTLLKEILSKNKNFQNFEVTHVFPEIGEKTMLLNAYLIFQKVKRKQLILLEINDITNKKRIEIELTEAKINAEKAKIIAEEATRIAEEAVKSKQQFLSNMSHEIRTPMNAIIGFTKVILKTELTAKQKEYLSAIRMSGNSLIVLIDDILDLAKVNAGKMEFVQNPFKLYTSITAITHLFEEKTKEKNLLLIQQYDDQIPDVLLGDSARLHQIILNLISNSLKFTSAGKIELNVNLVNQTQSSVTIEFKVIDTGIGIPADKLESIFENFQQAHATTSKFYGGTGLGLAIVKQLIELQGGTIHVESKLDEGSTFRFFLDFEKTRLQAEEDNEVIQLDSTIKNVRVLVVEDIALNQLLMKTILDDFGFDRDIAENGKIALEKVKQTNYDIILMDLQMPEMNGFEATEFIRKTLKSEVPIIALTADVTTVDLEKCKAVGMNDYIAKPVDEHLLYSKIVSLLKKTRPLAKPVQVKNNSDGEHVNLHFLLHKTKFNPHLMVEMISLYLEQTPPLIESMKISLTNKDWDLLQASAHKMIPSFLIMGIHSDYKIITEQIQQQAKNHHFELLPDLILTLETKCNQACQELEKELIWFKKECL